MEHQKYPATGTSGIPGASLARPRPRPPLHPTRLDIVPRSGKKRSAGSQQRLSDINSLQCSSFCPVTAPHCQCSADLLDQFPPGRARPQAAPSQPTPNPPMSSPWATCPCRSRNTMQFQLMGQTCTPRGRGPGKCSCSLPCLPACSSQPHPPEPHLLARGTLSSRSRDCPAQRRGKVALLTTRHPSNAAAALTLFHLLFTHST